MKRAIPLLTLILMLTGCATGRLIGAAPVVDDMANAATVVVARPFNIFGMSRRPTILIDGKETYDLGPGEHVSMAVAPGERLIGMYIWDIVPVRASVKIQAVAGRAYYFIMTPMARLSEVTEAEGRERVADTTPVQQ